MIDAGKAIAYLDLDATGFKHGIGLAKQLTHDLNSAAMSASGKVKALGGAMSTAGKLGSALSAVLIAAGTAAGTMSAHLDTAARKVATIADAQVMSLGQIKDETRALGEELGVMPTQLTEALYNTISATNDTKSAMGTVEVATKAAVGGFTDATTAVDGLTTVTNAYGMQGAASVKKVSDQMLTAQNYGKTTFGEIASGIGNVIPLAAQLQVGTEELFGAIAALTRQGIGTSESITGLKAAFSNIIKPTAEAQKQAKALGLEFNASALQSKGLAGFLQDVAQKTGGSTEKMSLLFGSVEALNAVLALTGADGAKYFAGALDAMAASAGATDKAFEMMSGGVEGTISRIRVQASNIATTFGDIMLPTIGDVMNTVEGMLAGFREMPEATQSSIVTIAAWVAAAGPMLLIGGKLVSMFGWLTGVLSGPTGLAVLGVAGVAALTLAITQMDKASTALKRSLDNIDPREVQAYQQAFDAIDTNIDLNATVNDNATPSVEGAVGKLKKVLLGIDVLDDGEREGIISLIGQDVDPILAALQGAGVDTSTPEGGAVAAKIVDAASDLHAALAIAVGVADGLDLPGAAALIDQGKQDIIDALIKAGAAPAEAETAATQIIAARDGLTEACNGLKNTVPDELITSLPQIIAEDKSALVTALSGLGLSETDISGIVTALSKAQTSLAGQVGSLYDTIYNALTDGKPDTEGQTKALQEQAQTYYDDLVSKIKLDTESKLGALKTALDNGTLSLSEYEEKSAAVIAKNDELVGVAKSLLGETSDFITGMSGEATSVVEGAKGQLEEIAQKSRELYGEIMGMVAEASASGQNESVRMVRAGVTSAPDRVAEAFDATHQEYGLDVAAIRERAKAAKKAADDAWDEAYAQANGESDPTKRKALKDAADKQLKDSYAAIEQAQQGAEGQAGDEYKRNLNALFQGLMENLAESDPETVAKLQEYMDKIDLRDKLQEILKSKQQADENGQPYDGETDFTPEIMSALGIEGDFDPTMIENYLNAARLSVTDLTNGAITDLSSEIAGMDAGPLALAMTGLMDKGMLDGVDGINLDTIEGQLRVMLGRLDVPIAPTITVEPEVDSSKVPGAVAESTQGAVPEPVDVLTDVNVEPGTVDASKVDGAVEDAVQKSDGETVDVNANVNISASGGDAGASDGGAYAKSLAGTADQAQSAGGKVSASAAKGLGAGAGAARKAGADLGAGFVSGMASKMGAVISQATRLARAAINAINAEAQISSPSKVAMKSGEWTGEGYALGLRAKISDVMAASRAVGVAGLAGFQMAPSGIDPGLIYPERYDAGQPHAQQGAAEAPGSAGPNITMNINNPVVRSDSDIRKLVREGNRYSDQLSRACGGRKRL